MPTSPSQYESNPFDFRRPVRSPERFSGRNALRAAFGPPSSSAPTPREHWLISGGKKIGKTSSLNLIACLSRERDLLVVDLPLNDAVLESPRHFFGAMLVAAERALHRAAPSSVPSTDDFVPVEADEIGALVLGRCRDIGRLAAESDRGGVVVLIDNAELFSDDDDIFQVLHLLMERAEDWVFVLAGRPRFLEEIDDVFPALRSAAHELVLQPFRTLDAIGHCLTRHFRGDRRGGLRLDLQALADFAQASSGHPYLLLVFAHFAWEEREHADAELALSSRAIRRALAELARTNTVIPRESVEQLGSQLDVFDRLSGDELAAAAPLVHFEEMSIRELATALCLRDGCDMAALEDRRRERTDELSAELDRLVTVDVISRNEDRFHLRGKIVGRLYLQALATQRGVGFAVPFVSQPTYGRYMGYLLMQRARAYLPVVVPGVAELSGHLQQFDEGLHGQGDGQHAKADAFVEAAEKGSAVDMAEAGLFVAVNLSSAESTTLPPDSALIFVRLRLRVSFGSAGEFGTESAELSSLSWASSGMSPGDLQAALDSWQARTNESLREANIELVSVSGMSIDPVTTRRFVALVAPPVSIKRIIDFFSTRRLSEAVAFIRDILPAVEEARARLKDFLPPWVANDLYVRWGFLAAALGDSDDAEDALRRAQDQSADATMVAANDFLATYNLGYVRALRGEFAAAAAMLTDLCPRHSDRSDLYLLLYLPTDSAWVAPPAWNTMSVNAEDIACTVRAQKLVYDALSGCFSAAEFSAAVTALACADCCAANRLVGWTQLTRFGDQSAAVTAFERAAASPSAPEVCGDELAHARQAG